jgi:hypothetical protein
MPSGQNPPLAATSLLDAFEPPKAMVEISVRALRWFNTALDVVFYDVPGLRRSLEDTDAECRGRAEQPPSRLINFDALSDPEGALLLIDATRAPYVHRYTDVKLLLDSPYPESQAVEVATITGVGSSALGSAAFAWDVSAALKKPVLAIVPGYGVADVVMQALGGWFGFGLYNYLHAKSAVQDALAATAPGIAQIGRNLSASAPGAKTILGAPVFRTGSGSSDVLHALLQYRARPFKLLVGHSKGALQIGNAIGSLPPDRTAGLRVVTLGCPIAQTAPGVRYYQYLGLYDALGQLNSWGNTPDAWTRTWHSTDPIFPPAMDAGDLVEKAPDDPLHPKDKPRA